jgi:hypothetical protein
MRATEVMLLSVGLGLSAGGCQYFDKPAVMPHDTPAPTVARPAEQKPAPTLVTVAEVVKSGQVVHVSTAVYPDGDFKTVELTYKDGSHGTIHFPHGYAKQVEVEFTQGAQTSIGIVEGMGVIRAIMQLMQDPSLTHPGHQGLVGNVGPPDGKPASGK